MATIPAFPSSSMSAPERGDNHSSDTPRHPAKVRDPSSQFRNTVSVVTFSAEWATKEATTSSTTSWGNPGGRAPSKYGNDRQSVSVQSSARVLGDLNPFSSKT
eukprot:CAMPEP_0178846602 /NCGR_PEP_ID=MMETSP0746-20121128/18146_1 /TAXON_ID=913974 /ORGANISM="Nitzschia punctata, Strain CCMP561" /LENGTH=102 /DNA_ID=CAMNT_0020511051 /DNA_START=179 /DNA_END=487 /DNA_ORIENTATION=-